MMSFLFSIVVSGHYSFGQTVAPKIRTIGPIVAHMNESLFLGV